MTTITDDTRAGAIQRRVVEWANAALATFGTADGVGVEADATRAASLPDDGLEVRPEDWTVNVTLRFSEADEARSDDVLALLGEAAGTVTLSSGEAAEIEWPSGPGGLAADRVTDSPPDKPFRCTAAVSVTIPWPSRNDAGAASA